MVHVSAVAKNAADDKLRVSLRRFADTYNSPATVVMVTSDVNFSNDLHDLRHRHMFSVILVHNQQVSYALKACAHVTILFEEFIVDIPNREQDAVSNPTSLNHMYIIINHNVCIHSLCDVLTMNGEGDIKNLLPVIFLNCL